jgi:hypothetical protein
MKTVVLKSFEGKLADKIRLVQLLVTYDQEAGLKVAKEKVDQLIAGTSVRCAVEESMWNDFEKELIALNLKYEGV